MGSGGYRWKYEERGKRKRLRGRGNLGLSDKPQRGLLTPLVVLALSSHLTVWVSFIVPSRSLHGLISIQTQTSTSQRLKMACTGVSFPLSPLSISRGSKMWNLPRNPRWGKFTRLVLSTGAGAFEFHHSVSVLPGERLDPL